LLVVAGLFFALGLNALAMSIIGLYRGTGGVSLGALNLLVGLGLLRQDPYWRRWALAACWLGIAGTGIILAALVFGTPAQLTASLYGRPVSQMPRSHAFTLVLAGLAVTAWQLWVLRRPSVRALFDTNARRRRHH
jgi:hypothetical protein